MSTKIAWCDETINPIVGCSKVSEGCRNCYAVGMARRLAAMGVAGYAEVISGGAWNGVSAFVPSALRKPYAWKRPRSIFIGSMGDLFHESVPFEWVDDVMRMVWDNRQHTFIVLTKRAVRMREYFSGLAVPGTDTDTAKRLLARKYYAHYDLDWHLRYLKGRFLPNLVLGVSVEDQATADDRIPKLLEIPAVKRFVSLEPLIGALCASGCHERRTILSCDNRCDDEKDPHFGFDECFECPGRDDGSDTETRKSNWFKKEKIQHFSEPCDRCEHRHKALDDAPCRKCTHYCT